VKIAILLTALLSFNASANEHLAFTQQSQSAIKEFATSLKAELITAMKAGGPIEAITVCNQVAPKIAENLSQKYNMKIGRTSLKVRNNKNKADKWESEILTQFEYLKQSGDSINSLAFSEAISTDEGIEMRMMKAIPTGQVCLTCHGSNIAANVQARIHTLYPDDQATGFSVGDIRGAFTIHQAAQ